MGISRVSSASESTYDAGARDYHRQFEAAREDARNLVSGLTDAQFNWRPAPGRWSIAECLDHLNSAWGVLPRFDRKIADEKARGLMGTGPFRRSLLGNLYIRSVEPPVKRLRFKSPKRFAPKPDQPLEEVVPRFLKLQDELGKRVNDAAASPHWSNRRNGRRGIDRTSSNWTDLARGHRDRLR